MQLSRDEYLRISQFRDDNATTVATMGRIATAPAHRAFFNDDASDKVEARRLATRMETEPDENEAAREQVVASLRARVEAGTYHVSGEQVAEMMIRRLLADRVR